MNSVQKSTIEKHLDQLCKEMDCPEVLQTLQTKQILTNTNLELIRSEPTDIRRGAKLLEILKHKDNAWEALLDALTLAKQSYLVNLLKDTFNMEQMVKGAKIRINKLSVDS